MKIAIITGASSGMGKELVLAIDKKYDLDEIWVIARRKERLEELQSQTKNSIRVLAYDLEKKENIDEIKTLLEQEKPEIKFLGNVAGFGLFGYFEKLNLEEQLSMVDINSKALVSMCHISLPYMKEGDVILNLASNASWQPVPYLSIYAATKSFVLSFSRSLGKELESRKIHVLAVCPGWIDTEFMDRAYKNDVVTYYDRWYTAKQVIDKAMKDLDKKKKVSILGHATRRQVRLVKFLPVDLVMNLWCNQQKKSKNNINKGKENG